MGRYVSRTNQLFGRFLLLVIHISWQKLGSVEHFPSIGSWCRALGSSSLILVSVCWPIYTKQRHPLRCPRNYQLVPFRQWQRRSSSKLLVPDPCYVATEIQNWNETINNDSFTMTSRNHGKFNERLIRERKQAFKTHFNTYN